MNLFVDIDGTLTKADNGKWGEPNYDMINKVKELSSSCYLVIWSARGRRYAKKFCEKYEIEANVCLGKPHIIVDDNPTIRPRKRMPILSPEEFLAKDILDK